MLESFVKDNFDDLFSKWHVVLVDNLSDDLTKKALLKICEDPRFSYVKQPVPRSLKLNLFKGFNYGKTVLANPKIIGVFETDLEPNIKLLESMRDVLLSEQENGCCSVSPMYKWKDKFCYPTHKHWHTDPVYKKTNHGTLTKVHAVPFLCSFWSPTVFAQINNEKFREFYHLDSDFGKYLTERGYLHLRLRDASAVHTNGGKQSSR